MKSEAPPVGPSPFLSIPHPTFVTSDSLAVLCQPRPRGVKRPRPSTTPPVPMTPELLTTLQALLQHLAAPPFAKNFCRPVAEINAEVRPPPPHCSPHRRRCHLH